MKDIQIPEIDDLPKKARGGQKTPPLAKARNMLWYKGVRELTAITNPKLDEMFVWKSAGDYLKNTPAKVFERIEKTGMCPRGKGTGLKRSLPEIVKAVDQHPHFQGTAIIFNSKFWELLDLQSIDEADIVMRINNVFIEYGVQRYTFPAQEESWRIGRNPELDRQPPINAIEMMHLQNANLHKITWQYLMVLLYFFTRTTIFRDEIRIFETYARPLRKYFEENLGDLGSDCAADALKRIQAIKVMRLF